MTSPTSSVTNSLCTQAYADDHRLPQAIASATLLAKIFVRRRQCENIAVHECRLCWSAIQRTGKNSAGLRRHSQSPVAHPLYIVRSPSGPAITRRPRSGQAAAKAGISKSTPFRGINRPRKRTMGRLQEFPTGGEAHREAANWRIQKVPTRYRNHRFPARHSLFLRSSFLCREWPITMTHGVLQACQKCDAYPFSYENCDQWRRNMPRGSSTLGMPRRCANAPPSVPVDRKCRKYAQRRTDRKSWRQNDSTPAFSVVAR